MSLIPPIRLSASKYCTLLAIFISLNREIISPYSYYIKKGLIYIIIINSFSRQSSFYAKCTKLNTYTLCNICLVSFNKYAFPYYICHCTY